jgi:hypothetical protein
MPSIGRISIDRLARWKITLFFPQVLLALQGCYYGPRGLSARPVTIVNKLEAHVPKGYVEFYWDPQSDFPARPRIYEFKNGKETYVYTLQDDWPFSGERGVRHVTTPGDHVYGIVLGRTQTVKVGAIQGMVTPVRILALQVKRIGATSHGVLRIFVEEPVPLRSLATTGGGGVAVESESRAQEQEP